MVDRDGTNWQN